MKIEQATVSIKNAEKQAEQTINFLILEHPTHSRCMCQELVSLSIDLLNIVEKN